MKVDLENKAELRKKRTELQRLIAVIDFALGNVPKNGAAHGISAAPLPEVLSAVWDQLGDRFTSSDVYAMVDFDKRQAVKAALKAAVADELATVTEQGKGRRATVYKKN